ETKPWRMALKCAPWLIVLIIIGVFSELVLSQFQEKLAIVPALIFFIPVLMDTGGNAGGQTCGLIIRALALKEFEVKDFPKVVWKEIKTAALTGLIVSGFAFCVFLIEFSIPGLIKTDFTDFTRPLIVSGIVSLALFCAIVLSKFVACALPFIAVKLKKDPALTSQPFVTTIVDVCSLLIYFGIFSIFYVTGFFG
ncbi:MAG: magnesium transporter, partial [Bacilli bacterium]|nr:magnesium transporter [Bacilli bacterium]